MKGAKILIVEDDPSWRDIYAELLGPNGEGHRVTIAGSYDEAVRSLSVEQFAFVIIDLDLPRSEGSQLASFEQGIAVIDYVETLTSKPNLLVVTGHTEIPARVVQMLSPLGLDMEQKSASVDRILAAVREGVRTCPAEVVMKFGGTSMGTVESLTSVAGIVSRYTEQNAAPCVVVVSAMSKVTDALVAASREAQMRRIASAIDVVQKIRMRHIETAQKLLKSRDLLAEYTGFVNETCDDLVDIYRGVTALAEVSTRSLDLIAGYGERLSAPLLAAILKDRGTPVEAVQATSIIVTDDVFGGARPLLDQTAAKTQEQLIPLLAQGITPVVSGFMGSTVEGIPTTLGRGGSDYSATILGAVLSAKEVWIWTDVSGVKDADPNLIPDAAIIRDMSYEKAAELTYHGAKVLYAKALQPVMAKQIPIRILNTFAPNDPGTLIGATTGVEHAGIVLVSATGMALLTISTDFDEDTGSVLATHTLASLLRADMEILAHYQNFSQRSLSVIIREPDAPRAAGTLSREFRDWGTSGRMPKIATQGQIASVSLIGSEGISPIISGRALCALDAVGIKIISIVQLAGDRSLTIVLPQQALKQAVVEIHKAINQREAN